ncbi:hypothetical protein BVG19_g4496 [[Candida] boidinii]|nr:hypothetical protein BVG19_g4496 [[Candida] boidinii]OWB52115.1 hypothetical protein B5S27_g3687 [[Candida] boidinii]OWB68719.1 hypothetical protein B5S30_g4105 [[Candida] boidinii]OWB86212.1 hypothetical protein B5S33_g4895 [[Candida] boidinii]GMG00159.1 unnamed protein product [[Candida] boidinii]
MKYIKEPKGGARDVTGTVVMLLTKETDHTSLTSPNSTSGQQNRQSNENTIAPSVISKEKTTTDADLKSVSTNGQSTLKTTKDGIILLPQPCDDPNDPLNWPLWRRDLALVSIGWHCFVGGGQTPILTAGLSEMSKEFKESPATVAYLVGAFMLAMGVGSLFAAPTAVLYGKRLVYLVGISISFAGALWGANANSFGSLVGARVLMGFSFSIVESLPSSTVAEIYFAHERAYRLGLYTLLLLGGKNIVPLLAAIVFQQLDRYWLFYIVAIICFIDFFLIFFFVPETFWDRTPTPNKKSQEETEAARVAYELTHAESDFEESSIESNRDDADDNHHPHRRRHHRANSFAIKSHPGMARNSASFVGSVNSSFVGSIDTNAHENIENNNANTTNNIHTPHAYAVTNANDNNTIEDREKFNANLPAKRSYLSTLAVYSGSYSKDKWWMVFCRPIVLLLYPPVLFSSFIYCFAVVWLIMISEALSHIFAFPPYGYSPLSIGLFYVSPFVGGCLGSVLVGKISDAVTRYIVRKNNGVYEPEFRLITIIPVFFTVTIGLMGFGWSAKEENLWIVPVIFFGVMSFGCSAASTTAITYAVDSYKMFAAETLVTLNVMKNTVGFIFSLFNNNFIDARNPRTAFLTYGGVQMFLCLFAIPLFYYGKCTRAWTDDKEFMKYLYVRKDEDDDAIVDDENGKGINNGDNPNSQNPTSDLDTGNVLSNINKFDFANDDNNLPKKNDSSDESPREDEVDLGEKSPNSESNITHPAAETTRDSEK